MEEIIKTAHIHFEHATFRVHVNNSMVFNFEKMNEDENKPSYIMFVSRSNDPEQNKQSILVSVCEDYDLEEMADWISSHEI